jgi:hypothetical protein
MTYKELISSLYDDAKFKNPASLDEIEKIEEGIGIKFPDDLCHLLQETDGFSVNYSSLMIFGVNNDEIENYVTAWREFTFSEDYKELYNSFENMFFFASDGTGGFFAYLKDGNKCTSEIVHWEHEEDNRTLITKNGLHDFIMKYKDYGY